MRDRPLTITAHDLCNTEITPEHRRNRHRTSHRHRIENPVYLINGLFYWEPEKCCRNVTAGRYTRWDRRAESVGRSFARIGVRMHHRRSETRSSDARGRTLAAYLQNVA